MFSVMNIKLLSKKVSLHKTNFTRCNERCGIHTFRVTTYRHDVTLIRAPIYGNDGLCELFKKNNSTYLTSR